MVSTLVSLYERLGDVDGAARTFMVGEGNELAPQLARAAAAFFVRHGRWKDAAAAHTLLLDQNPRDVQVVASRPPWPLILLLTTSWWPLILLLT